MSATESRPFAGVRIVEFGQFIAVPFCAQLFAEGGAEIIKVEAPAGDPTRHIAQLAPNETRIFVSRNRGYAFGEAGILVSQDGGQSWESESVVEGSSLGRAFFLDESTGWAGARRGGIVRTLDGGRTWQRVGEIGTSRAAVSPAPSNSSKS